MAVRAGDAPVLPAELEVSVRRRFELPGTARHCASSRVIPLPRTAHHHEEGALDPRVAAA